MYVGVDNFREPDRCQHLFTGEMKPYDTITHMVLHNQINAAEKMYICMLNPMQTRTPAVGMLSGIGSSPFFASSIVSINFIFLMIVSVVLLIGLSLSSSFLRVVTKLEKLIYTAKYF